MKVAITGAGGLLGRFLVEAFAEAGHMVTAIHREGAQLPVSGPGIRRISGDVELPESLLSDFEGLDLVVHAAAVVSLQNKDRDLMFRVNAEGTRHVVDACLMCGVKRLIHISSVAAVGSSERKECIDEDAPWDGGRSAYAQSKYEAETHVFRGAAEGMEVQVVNPSVILAPAEKGRSSMRLIDYIRSGGRFYTDGLVNLVDVRDVAAAVLGLSAIPAETPERFILNGFTLTYQEFFSKLAKELGRRPPVWRASRTLLITLVTLIGWTGIIGLSRSSVEAAFGRHRYDGRRICSRLGISYRRPEETLAWVCREIRTDA